MSRLKVNRLCREHHCLIILCFTCCRIIHHLKLVVMHESDLCKKFGNRPCLIVFDKRKLIPIMVPNKPEGARVILHMHGQYS